VNLSYRYIACFLRYMMYIQYYFCWEYVCNNKSLFLVYGHKWTYGYGFCVYNKHIWSTFCYIYKAHTPVYDKREIVISFIFCAERISIITQNAFTFDLGGIQRSIIHFRILDKEWYITWIYPSWKLLKYKSWILLVKFIQLYASLTVYILFPFLKNLKLDNLIESIFFFHLSRLSYF